MNEKTPAPVGAAVALDLAEIEARFADATADEVIYELWPALVAEVRRLTEARAECERQFQAQVAARTAEAEAAEAEVGTLRANWRHVTTALGYGDGITEPQIGHRDFVAECERQFSEASEWRESQRWRDECHDAGHPDDEDCYEHDPALVMGTLRARLAAVEALPPSWIASTAEGMGRKIDHWRGDDYAEGFDAGVESCADTLRAALATTGEGEHVARDNQRKTEKRRIERQSA